MKNKKLLKKEDINYLIAVVEQNIDKSDDDSIKQAKKIIKKLEKLIII